MFDLVGNTEDCFSSVVAHMIIDGTVLCMCFSLDLEIITKTCPCNIQRFIKLICTFGDCWFSDVTAQSYFYDVTCRFHTVQWFVFYSFPITYQKLTLSKPTPCNGHMCARI